MLISSSSQVSEVSGVQATAMADLTVTSAGFQEVSASPVESVPESVLPKESDRPCYRVFDDPKQVGDARYRAGVWYFGIKAGRGEAPPTLIQQWVCSPMHIDAVTTDPNAGNFGRLLRFRTTLGKWRTWAMPMELLRGDCSDLRGELLSMGVEIDPHGRQMLAFFLQAIVPKRRILCALQTGWAGTDFKAFVLPDDVIGPKAAMVTYQTGERGHDEYTTAGTLPGWQAGVASLAVGNPLLVLALSTAFAGPVLARCNAESGGIHFIGDSSTGKTTAIEAACSVWGGANFKRSWRATGNGMEGVAALFNDSLLALDEISECDPREVGAIVYALGNGRGKQRASRTGSARSVARWRCSVLSSGERSIGTTMAEGGHRVKAGQSVRLLDVPATRAHGAWDTLHQYASGTAFSDALKRHSVSQYGHAGRAFLQRLTRDHDANFCDALDKIKALPAFAAPNDEGQAKRAASRFAVLALAGELATEYGVTGWPKGEAIKAAAAGFSAWNQLRGKGRGNLERDQVAERMSGFIERHGDSRFSDVESDDEKQASMVRERAGWWQSTGAGRRYLFTAEGMREALKGFDFNRALDALQEAGAIDPPGADGKRAKFRRIRGAGVKLYAVDPGHLDTGA
jgi:putative DNA primase/helicase